MRMNEYKIKKGFLDGINFNPYFPIVESDLNDRVIIDGQDYINLASNNYLGLANDERIKKASIDAINKYGVSLCGTPVVCGYIGLFEKLERKIAGFVGCESSLIFPSCYQANNGLFGAILEKDDVVIVDRYAHSSLIEGIRMTRCVMRLFLHNDMNDLEKFYQKHRVIKTGILLPNPCFQRKEV